MQAIGLWFSFLISIGGFSFFWFSGPVRTVREIGEVIVLPFLRSAVTSNLSRSINLPLAQITPEGMEHALEAGRSKDAHCRSHSISDYKSNNGSAGRDEIGCRAVANNRNSVSLMNHF